MSIVVQWIIAALVVVAAAIYLIKRLTRPSCEGCCSHCPSGCKMTEEAMKNCEILLAKRGREFNRESAKERKEIY